MSVKAEDLNIPERNLRLTTREGEAKPRADPAGAELVAMRERILAAKVILPAGAELHCRDCWTRGRDAALRLVEGKT